MNDIVKKSVATLADNATCLLSCVGSYNRPHFDYHLSQAAKHITEAIYCLCVNEPKFENNETKGN